MRLRDGVLFLNGDSAVGAFSLEGGQVELERVSVTTLGNDAHGAIVQGGGSVQVLDSSLDTSGQEAHGVMLMGEDDNQATATIRNSQIVTRGPFAIGVNVNFDANATIQNSQINTLGEGSHGIWLATSTTDATISDVLIATRGDSANGISSEGGTATLQDVTISTHGQEANGLYSQSDTARLDAQRINITIEQSGAGALAVDGSTITLDTGTVTARNDAIGLHAANDGNLVASHLQVQADGSNARALMLTAGAKLTLDDVKAKATGTGSAGLWSIASSSTQLNQATVKDSSLSAQQSTAIAVRGGQLDLTLDNTVVEGKRLLDIDANADVAHGRVQIEARDSTLRGDIRVADASSGDATLQLRNSTLSGAVQGLDRLEVLANSRWTLTADSTLGDLINQGTVAFQPGSTFKTLTVEGDLSGSGTFALNTDLARQQGDLLRVQGTLSGNHTLAVADTGHEPSAPEGKLRLVDGNGGTGTFALAGRPYVDAGAYRYSLQQDGDDWLLRHTGPADKPEDSLSTGANAALASQTAASTLWSAEMNALVKRLGELRMGHDQGGLWSRAIGKTYEVDTAHSRDFEQAVHGMEIGADKAIQLNGSTLYVGGMLGMATSTQNFGDGQGAIDSQMLGAYATWLNDSGYYVDTVAKYNRLQNEVKNQANTGEEITGQYDTHGYAGDVEIGRHITLGDGWFIEPQGELTYAHTAGARYTASNGLNVNASDTDSLQGRLGSLFGRNWTLRNGMPFQPYVKASYVHEFAGASSVRVNGHKLSNRIAGSRAEYGLGGVLQVSEKTKVSLDIQQAKGDQVQEPWALNLGARYLW